MKQQEASGSKMKQQYNNSSNMMFRKASAMLYADAG